MKRSWGTLSIPHTSPAASLPPCSPTSCPLPLRQMWSLEGGYPILSPIKLTTVIHSGPSGTSGSFSAFMWSFLPRLGSFFWLPSHIWPPGGPSQFVEYKLCSQKQIFLPFSFLMLLLPSDRNAGRPLLSTYQVLCSPTLLGTVNWQVAVSFRLVYQCQWNLWIISQGEVKDDSRVFGLKQQSCYLQMTIDWHLL